MKRFISVLLVLLLLTGTAAAEVLGFGFVNADQVALRREPGGAVVLRVPQDTCLWISDSRLDKKGKLWYKVNTGLHIDHANYDCYGWMMADFVDCGEKVWHDVAAVSCSPFCKGAMVLFRDGTAVTASRPIVSADGVHWTNARRMTDGVGKVRQVLSTTGLNYYYLDRQGQLFNCWKQDDRSSSNQYRIIGGLDGFVMGITQDDRLGGSHAVNMSQLQWVLPAAEPSPEVLSRVRSICGNDWLLMVTDTGELLAAQHDTGLQRNEYPDWSQWQGIKGLDFGICCYEDRQTIRSYVYAAVKQDGTPLLYPEDLYEAAGEWKNLKDIQVGQDYLLVLKNDGTVFAVSMGDHPAPDVTAWRDIAAIEAGPTYCIGLREDGTLVFAGQVTFMGEGHTRK